MRQDRAAKTARTPPDSDALAVQGFLAFAYALIVSYIGVGAGAFGAPDVRFFILASLAGLVAALACPKWFLAGPAAGTGVILGTLFASRYSLVGPGRLALSSGYLFVAALAILVGVLTSALLERRSDLTRWIVWLGVGFVLLVTCLDGWANSTSVNPNVGSTPVEYFKQTPVMSADSSDQDVFILTIRRMDAGTGYYAAMGRTLTELNARRPWAPDDTSLPTTFRMPTLYWFLAALPQNGVSWVTAMLVLVGAAVTAAWSIADRYVRPPVTLIGAMLTGAYLANFVNTILSEAETWAGMLGLLAVALAVKSLSVRRKPLAWATAAAVFGLLATLTRELAVAYLLIGLASSLVAERTHSRRLWIPWAVALGLAAIAYVAHVQAFEAISRTLPQMPPHAAGLVAVASYFDPSGRQLAESVRMVAVNTWWTVPVAWAVWALGTVGGPIAPADLPRRIMLGGVTVGGAVALFFLHPTAVQNSPVPPAWGFAVLPTTVACAPLAFARIPWVKRKRAIGT